MKIDVLTIFPDYLAPVSLSLVGKAISSGRVEINVHDLRSWTSDRHRTVDDTPYGGGAGMVMRPEPWGEALDDVADRDSRLVVLTPSGRPFTQALAEELATEPHVVLACGRYEGIDHRVVEHAEGRMGVDEVSIGDYVLNGGEAAALVIIEAVVRLLPGVLGNPDSLTEESHATGHDRLLEYPLYTKPPSWRGLEVPEVLLSGHHGQIAAWRRERAVELTRSRRPDLLPPSEQPVVITSARAEDAGELLALQRAAYVEEGRNCGTFDIPPLTETLAEVQATLADCHVLVARRGTRLVGSVLGRREDDGAWYIGRLMVAPDQQGQGIGSALMTAAEAAAPAEATVLRLFTGAASEGNIGFYTRRGYRAVSRTTTGSVPIVVLEKPLGPARASAESL